MMVLIMYPPQIWKMKGMCLTENLILKLLLFWARTGIQFLMECKTLHLWSTLLLFCLQMLLLQDIILLKLEKLVSVSLLCLMCSLPIYLSNRLVTSGHIYDFKDDQGNQLQIGELNYVSKKGKSVFLFTDNDPARDIKLALSLVVRLLLEHSSVTDDKSCIND